MQLKNDQRLKVMMQQ